MKLRKIIHFSVQEGGMPYGYNEFWYSKEKDDIFSAQEIVINFSSFRNDQLINMPYFDETEMVYSFLQEEGYGFLIEFMESVCLGESCTFNAVFRQLLESSDERLCELERKWNKYYREAGTKLVMSWIEKYNIPYEDD